ncbi:MAG: universal stress protein [Planctomycetaceae bacterium]|nr:universal stress protein [Planctomycetaceae bacterium]
MAEIKRILLATDFSECSNHAREFACQIASQFKAELHLLYVIHDMAVEVPDFGMGLAFPGYLENVTGVKRELSMKAHEKLEAELSEPWVEQLQVVHSVRFGIPATKIVEYAQEHEIDLIVIGTHGRVGIPHVLLGSVAERVIKHAPCPVTTVRLP